MQKCVSRKGIQTSVTSLTSGVHSQLVSNSSKMFSKFKVEKPSHVLYKRGARHFEAEKTGNTLFLVSVETYDQQIRLMRAEIERLKTMKSIDQVIIQRNWHSLEPKRSSYKRRSSFRVTVSRKEWKKIQYERSVSVVFSHLGLILVLRTK